MDASEATAPAKVNLYLKVTGRRDDGYHLLDMLVVFASIGDTIAARPADGLSLGIGGPFAPTLDADGGENLVLTAARLLAEALGRAPDVALHLVKRLPVASGIGGGSSDAAATLRLLGRLWSADPATLDTLALRLGADVPVCLRATPTRVGGIGEQLGPVPPVPPLAIVLVNPGVPLSTPLVFKTRRGPFSPPVGSYPAWASAAALADWLRPLGNDLAAPAIAIVPAIGPVLDAIAATPDCLLARLSGSGATCFGLYATQAQAEAAARSIQARDPGWWVRAGTVAPPGLPD